MSEHGTASQAKHKSVVVTGASSGIGAEIALKLLAMGWRVTGLSRSKPQIEHERFSFMSVDLGSRAAVEETLRHIHSLDALVHAAGILRVGAVGSLDLDDGQDMWRLHVEASAQLIDRLAPRLSDGGRIVLLGSRTARGSASRAQYAASKAAMVGLGRSCAIELAPRGITVNIVSPGATDTPMLKDPKRANVAPKMPPIGRLVKPQEVAALVSFLLSEDAASITGQEILVCGGASL